MNQKYNYWLSQAVEKRNLNLCNNVEGYDAGDYKISRGKTIYSCKAKSAGIMGNLDYCSKLDSYVCFHEIADRAKNLEICNKLPDASPVNVRYECYTRVAIENKDSTICQRIPSKGYSHRGSRSNCLSAVEEKIKTIKKMDAGTENN